MHNICYKTVFIYEYISTKMDCDWIFSELVQMSLRQLETGTNNHKEKFVTLTTISRYIVAQMEISSREGENTNVLLHKRSLY